jgi:mannan endo-1,4-beta-mannosidase
MKSVKSLLTTVFLAGLLAGVPDVALATDPVSPNASPEAKALLDLFYRISGKYTLTGQHNYPNTKDRNTRFAANYIGQTPAIWSTDMGFAEAGDYDSYLARPDIVKEAIRQHKKGSIITICWHAVPPTADEPVTFRPRRDSNPDSLASVQGQLMDRQFRDVLTPGTKLYDRWCTQVDSVAVYLKQLRDAGVPVLWRPYHEMNGDWFWWGGRVGEYSTADLYRQLYDRYVNYHKLNNLVWVWNVDRPSTPIRKFSNFYPGNEYLDILSLDVYGSDFNQDYYDSLLALSHGKPILFGEVGNPPTPDILDKQPLWASWVIWAGMVRNLTKQQHLELVNDPRILSQEDPTYRKVMAPYRKACGLPVLPLADKYPVNFSGRWLFDEEKSEVGNRGAGNVPWEMEVDQDDDLLHVKKVTIVEWDDDRVSHEDILLDGTEMKSEFFNSPRISTARWEENCRCVVIDSQVSFNRGDQVMEMKSREVWSLEDGGKVLKITQTSTGFRDGENSATWVYGKQGM